MNFWEFEDSLKPSPGPFSKMIDYDQTTTLFPEYIYNDQYVTPQKTKRQYYSTPSKSKTPFRTPQRNVLFGSPSTYNMPDTRVHVPHYAISPEPVANMKVFPLLSSSDKPCYFEFKTPISSKGRVGMARQPVQDKMVVNEDDDKMDVSSEEEEEEVVDMNNFYYERSMSLRNRSVVMNNPVDLVNEVHASPVSNYSPSPEIVRKKRSYQKTGKNNVNKRISRVIKRSKLPRRKSLNMIEKIVMTEEELRERLGRCKDQKGSLPKRALNLLKEWFVKNWRSPYPNKNDKEMFRRRTGLSNTQICNWFTNKRKRVWKPLILEKLNQ